MITYEQLRARDTVVDAAKAWRASTCPNQNNREPDTYCDGDNHIESCPVEIARQDLIAALDALSLVHG